jgi:hypothetical protein
MAGYKAALSSMSFRQLHHPFIVSPSALNADPKVSEGAKKHAEKVLKEHGAIDL